MDEENALQALAYQLEVEQRELEEMDYDFTENAKLNQCIINDYRRYEKWRA